MSRAHTVFTPCSILLAALIYLAHPRPDQIAGDQHIITGRATTFDKKVIYSSPPVWIAGDQHILTGGGRTPALQVILSDRLAGDQHNLDIWVAFPRWRPV